MVRGEAYDEMLARQMGEADCDTYLDGNGEVQRSDSGPDRIGDPPKVRPTFEPITPEILANAEEF